MSVANRPKRSPVVAIAVLPGMPLFEIGVPLEVFGSPRPGLVEPPYEMRLCAVPTDGHPPVGSPGFALEGGFGLEVGSGLDRLVDADTVIVPALATWDAELPTALIAALRTAHESGARLVGLCTGAFALGAAGLLDGIPATTHWMYADRLAARHPRALVDANVLYAGTETVMTSAGTASGIDLCLELLRRDHGEAVANDVARRMVIAPRREGGQAQFVKYPTPTADRGLAPALDWALEHLHEQIAPADIATAAHVSLRTLSRRFHAGLGKGPAQWLNEQRVRRAQELIEKTGFPIGQIAAMAGFASESTMRAQFGALVGTSPQTYRRTFNPAPSEHTDRLARIRR